MSIAQTSQLLQLVLNSALMMVIALIWWGIVIFRLNTVSNQLQRLKRQYRRTQPNQNQRQLRLRLRHHRHDLAVRYRLTRHSALIMHYVLLALMASLFLLSLRALVNSNLLITAALCLFVTGAAGILLSVALALIEFYQLNVLMGHGMEWGDAQPAPSSMLTVAPQYQMAPQSQPQPSTQYREMSPEELTQNLNVGSIAS